LAVGEEEDKNIFLLAGPKLFYEALKPVIPVTGVTTKKGCPTFGLFGFLVSIFEGLIYLLAVGSVVGDTCGDDTFEVTLVATLVGLAVCEWVGVVAIHTRIATAEATRVGDGATGLTSLRITLTAIGAVAVAVSLTAVVARLVFIVVGQSAPPRSEVSGATILRRAPVCLVPTTPVDDGLTVCVATVLVLNINQSWFAVGELLKLSVEVLDEVATVEVLLELIEGKCDGERHIV